MLLKVETQSEMIQNLVDTVDSQQEKLEEQVTTQFNLEKAVMEKAKLNYAIEDLEHRLAASDSKLQKYGFQLVQIQELNRELNQKNAELTSDV
jgi:predicted RNase H-like nuclease (RuvC/YqgF family)